MPALPVIPCDSQRLRLRRLVVSLCRAGAPAETRRALAGARPQVHSAEGQFRALGICVISLVAISINMAVYSPRLVPPLEHFVPPLALQIVRGEAGRGRRRQDGGGGRAAGGS
jgi:hypothetical protein